MSKYRNPWLLVALVITGVVLGNVIGTTFAKTVPLLNYGPEPLGLKDFQVNLGIIYFHLTFLVDINVASLIGLLSAILIFKKL